MENQTDTVSVPTSTSRAVDQLEKSYDAEVKNFLREKQILANILKGCVIEFKDCSVEDIVGKYIEGVPQVAAVAVDQDAEVPFAELPIVQQSQGSKIIGASNELESRKFFFLVNRHTHTSPIESKVHDRA